MQQAACTSGTTLSTKNGTWRLECMGSCGGRCAVTLSESPLGALCQLQLNSIHSSNGDDRTQYEAGDGGVADRQLRQHPRD